MDKLTHKKQTIGGVKWNLASQLVSMALLFSVGVVLMRMLNPAEFGLIGMVNVFSGFLIVLSNFGIGSSLIQMKNIDELDKCTVFWFSLLISATLSICLIIASPFIAYFYKQPQLVNIAISLSGVFVLQSLGAIHNVLLRKNLEFKKLFFVNTAAGILASVVAIVCAVIGFGVWSLVLQQTCMAFATSIFLWYSSPFRPAFIFSKQRLKNHLNFGLPLLGSNSINYWISSGDNLLIGKFLGVEVLGFYSRAYSMVTLPSRRLNIVFSSVLFPSFSQIRDDLKRVKQIYLRAIRVIAFFLLPGMGLLIVISYPLIAILAGEKWFQMVPILQILAIVAAIKSFTFLNSNVLLSQGKSKTDFKINTFSGLFVLSAFAIGVQYGMMQVGYAYLAAVLIITIPIWYLSGKAIECTVRETFLNLFPLIIFSIFLTIAGLYVMSKIDQLNNYLKIGISSIQYFLGWIFCTRFFYKKSFDDVILMVKESTSK